MIKNKLSSDFKLERYGVQVRFANEDDSEFILSLRTNPELSRFIHSTDNDVEKQREWMRNYKLREANGEDYYFIYYYNGFPYGVNRIYDIKEDNLTVGSWICKPETQIEQVMASDLICQDIIFDILGYDQLSFDVRKGNKKVQRLHKYLGAKVVGESDIDFYYIKTKEVYHAKREEIVRLLDL